MKIKKLMALLLAGALTVSAFIGCGVDKDATVATIGEQEISLGLVNFMCRYQQAQISEAYVYYFGEDVWTQDIYGTGTTMEEDMISEIVEEVHEMYTLKAHMSDYNVEITAEEEEKIAEAVKAFMEANSKEALEEMGATEELVTEMLTLRAIKEKMEVAIKADVDREVSDEEANMRAYSMVTINIAGEYDSSYTNYTEYTEDEVAEITSNAEKMEEALKAGGENVTLESVAEEYGYSVTTGTYDADNETLNADVKTTLDSLSVGEISGLITTESELYFVRLDAETDETATETNRNSIITEREDALYTEVLEGWQENDGWKLDEKKLEQIKFKNNFTQTTESTETESTESTESTETQSSESTESTETESTETESTESTEES